MTATTLVQIEPAAAPLPADPRAEGDRAARDVVAFVSRPRALMPRWDDLPLRTKGMCVIVIPFVPLILSAILFVVCGRTARLAQEWVSHTLEVKAEIVTILSLMVDAESGVRGFLLTREADALVPFTIATAVLAAARQAPERRGSGACNGYADRTGHNPALLLLDLKMPKVDGIEVLRQVKSDPALKTIPVVVLTSSREERDLLRTYDLGVNAYVVKPVDFHEFVDAVKMLGSFWTVVNETPPQALGMPLP